LAAEHNEWLKCWSRRANCPCSATD